MQLVNNMRQIEYNTFGASLADNRLVDFLNSLREASCDPKLAHKLQRSVMHYIHTINAELNQFPCHPAWRKYEINETADLKNPYLHKLYLRNCHSMFLDSPVNRKIVNLYVKELKRRLHTDHTTWSDSLKGVVWGAVLEKLRIWGLR